MNDQIKLYGESSFKNLWSVYHLRFVKGAYQELVATSPMKDYVKNESALEDGVRYSLPVNGAKMSEKANFPVPILIDVREQTASGTTKKTQAIAAAESFIFDLAQGPFELKIPALNSVFRLVFEQAGQINAFIEGVVVVTLRLTEPNPLNRDE